MARKTAIILGTILLTLAMTLAASAQEVDTPGAGRALGSGGWWTKVETTTPQEADFVAKVAELDKRIRAGDGDVDALRTQLCALQLENRELKQRIMSDNRMGGGLGQGATMGKGLGQGAMLGQGRQGQGQGQGQGIMQRQRLRDGSCDGQRKMLRQGQGQGGMQMGRGQGRSGQGQGQGLRQRLRDGSCGRGG